MCCHRSLNKCSYLQKDNSPTGNPVSILDSKLAGAANTTKTHKTLLTSVIFKKFHHYMIALQPIFK